MSTDTVRRWRCPTCKRLITSNGWIKSMHLQEHRNERRWEREACNAMKEEEMKTAEDVLRRLVERGNPSGSAAG